MSIRDTLISARKAKALRARANRHAEWAKQFRKPNGWTVITKEEQATCPRNARITNEELGRLEQFEVWRDKPERLFAYVKFSAHGEPRTASDVRTGDVAAVTTWPGTPLGYGTVGHVWRSNFGDRRASLSVIIAGERYSGTAYIGAGEYCELTRRTHGASSS